MNVSHAVGLVVISMGLGGALAATLNGAPAPDAKPSASEPLHATKPASEPDGTGGGTSERMTARICRSEEGEFLAVSRDEYRPCRSKDRVALPKGSFEMSSVSWVSSDEVEVRLTSTESSKDRIALRRGDRVGEIPEPEIVGGVRVRVVAVRSVGPFPRAVFPTPEGGRRP